MGRKNSDSDSDRGRPHDGKVHPPNAEPIDGPISDRKCRDVLFLLLFIAMWFGMFLVMGIALDKGDPGRLVLPMDYAGNFCGRDNTDPASRPWMDQNRTELMFDFTTKPYLYFVNPFVKNQTICVEQCPGKVESDLTCVIPDSAVPDVGVDTSSVIASAQDNPKCACTYKEDDRGVHCFLKYQSDPILWRCVPGNASLIGDALASENSKLDDMITRSFDDVRRGYEWVLLSGLVALLLGFVWLLLMRFLAGIIVWLTIALCFAACVALSFYTFNEGTDRKDVAVSRNPEDPDEVRNANAVLYTSYAFMGITFIIFCIIVFMFKRIQIAIEIVKFSGRAVASMPTLVLIPVIGFVAAGVMFLYLAVIGAYLYSAGEVQYIEGFRREFVFDDELKKVIAYHVFGCIWTIMFILAVVQTSIAGAVAQYYFTRDKSDLPLSPVMASVWRVFRYHMGSLAFGSLIIAIVIMIRLTLEYIKRQLKKDNQCLKQIICIINCCMECFQRFIEFLTTNAYIQIAITGDSFCTAAKNGWSLIVRNVLRVTAVSVISTFIIFLGKLFIVVCAVLACNEMLKSEDIHSYLLLLMAFFLAYVIACLFLAIYEMAIKTILQCFCEDEERNDQPYAPEDLRVYMDKNTNVKKHGT